MIDPASPLMLLRVAYSRFGASPGASANETTGAGDVLRVSRLEPNSVALLYGPRGLLAGEDPPGGTGAARSISNDNAVLVASGLPAFDYSKFAIRAHQPSPVDQPWRDTASDDDSGYRNYAAYASGHTNEASAASLLPYGRTAYAKESATDE